MAGSARKRQRSLSRRQTGGSSNQTRQQEKGKLNKNPGCPPAQSTQFASPPNQLALRDTSSSAFPEPNSQVLLKHEPSSETCRHSGRRDDSYFCPWWPCTMPLPYQASRMANLAALLVRPRLVAGTAFGLLFTSTISVAQAEVPWPELVMLHLPCTMACLPTVMLRPTYQMMGVLQQCRDSGVTEDVWVEGARLGPRAAQASTSAQFHEDSGVRRLLRRRE